MVAITKCGELDLARVLLDGGADPCLAREDGYTPLMTAVDNGHLEVAAGGAFLSRRPCIFHYRFSIQSIQRT
jgi:ankyrin repeat protein